MTRSVLVPVDGSPLSERALAYAFEHFPDAELTALYVIDPVNAVYDVEAGGLPEGERWYAEAQEAAEAIHEEARGRADAHGASLTTATEVGRPASVILDYADEHGVDGIVMGSHGREGIGRVLLGSVAETVARRSDVPVTIVR